MGKILGSWSGMRKYLEEEMIADSLKGRIRYSCTSYVGMHGCHIFEIRINGETFKRFSLETVNTYFINNGFTERKNHYCTAEYWSEFWTLLDKYAITARTEYTDEEFCNALNLYRNQDIRDSIYSKNPLVRMFAISDRRIGKRTLYELNAEELPEWLRTLYNLRISAECN